MNKAVGFLLLVLSFFSFTVAGTSAKLEMKNNGYTMKFELPSWGVYEVDTLGENRTTRYGAEIYSRIAIDDYFTTEEVGKAELPVFKFEMAIRSAQDIPTFTLNNVEKSHTNLQYSLYPYQTPWAKSSTVAERTFSINRSYYNSRGEKSHQVWTSEPYTIRGVVCVTVYIRPFEYNPATKQLTYIKKFDLDIHTNTSSRIGGLDSKEFERLLRHSLVNFEEAVVPALRGDKENFLIITDPQYKDQLAEYVDFREGRFNVDLFSVSDAGGNASGITSFVQSRYDNPETRPTFLLLVGDVETVPASQTGTYSDSKYGLPASNNAPNVFVGRFSVRSASELQNIMDKSMYMEKNLASIDRKGLFIGGVDAGNGHVAEATHNYVISNYFNGKEYESVKRYSNSDNSVVHSVIKADLNSGYTFAMYSGHGSPTAWAASRFNFKTTDFKALTNTTHYPFTYTFACQTGKYQNSECLSEAIIRGKAGGVSNWGSCLNTMWTPDDKVERGMVNAMGDENDPVTLVSSSFIAGLIYNGGRTYFQQYNLMGDPAMEMDPDNLVSFLEVAAPKGGEEWEQDRAHQIIWTTNAEGDVKIELLDDGSVKETIVASTPADKPYEWKIPGDFKKGKKYKIRITSLEDNTVVGESENVFAIGSKSKLEIKTPNGGETFEKESEITITWEDDIDEDVKIELVEKDRVAAEISAGIASNGSYKWKIPATTASGTDYSIRITSTKASKLWLYTESEKVFSIQNPMVKDLPYVKNFDDLDTATNVLTQYWEQLRDDDINWNVHAGKTPSQSSDQATGPVGDHTSGNGIYYYVEASAPNNPGKKATIISPMFELGDMKYEFSFWYHMFSDNKGKDEMGTLDLDVYQNGAWKASVVSISKSQGTAWLQKKLNLQGNDKVQFRFRAETGASWASDIAIDDIILNGIPEFDNLTDVKTAEGIDFKYEIMVKDDKLADVKIEAMDLPNWLKFEDKGNGKGVFSGKADKAGKEYTIKVKVTDGLIAEAIEKSFDIKVEELKAPKITEQPKDVKIVKEGKKATFEVEAEGYALEYQWEVDGKEIKGATEASYTTEEVEKDDDGKEFRCVVTNPAGEEKSEKAELTVKIVSIHTVDKDGVVRLAVAKNARDLATFKVNVQDCQYAQLKVYDNLANTVFTSAIPTTGGERLVQWENSNKLQSGARKVVLYLTKNNGSQEVYSMLVGLQE